MESANREHERSGRVGALVEEVDRAMRLGYACTNMTLGYSVRELRLATLRAHGMPAVQALLDENLRSLTDILRWNRAHAIAMYRIPANLVPFGNHDEVDLARLDFSGAHEVPALARGIRLSVHPGHFTLVSAAGDVWERSRADLLYHAALFDILGIGGDITIHGGGVYGDPAGTAARIERNIEALPDEARRHLRLENDERAWSVAALLPICERTGTPLVVDNLHHALNGETPLSELPWGRIGATWRGRTPKLHYSEQDPAKKAGAHSAYVNATAFRRFATDVGLADFDVMLECKAKELALLRLREEVAKSCQ